MPIPLDKITGAALTIDIEHREIHDGHYFKAFYESVAPLPTDIGAETAIGFLTPPLPTRIHMVIDADADDESTFEFREDPTVVLDQGVFLEALNRYRSGGGSLILDHSNPGVALGVTTYTVLQAAAADLSASGSILHSETLAIAAGPPFGSILNDRHRGQREWILRPDTEYVAILTNLTANDTVHKLTLNWYETVDHHYIA